MRRRDGDPSAIAWLVALVSMALPWAGVGLGLAGGWKLSHRDTEGWWLLGLGAGFLIADVLIDFVWAHPAMSRSDEPDLNRRAAQLVGRTFVVEEAIEGGRGKVRVGDTLWSVEGPDAPAGTRVRVTSSKGSLLVVGQD